MTIIAFLGSRLSAVIVPDIAGYSTFPFFVVTWVATFLAWAAFRLRVLRF